MTEVLEQRVVAAIGDQYELDCEIGRGGMASWTAPASRSATCGST